MQIQTDTAEKRTESLKENVYKHGHLIYDTDYTSIQCRKTSISKNMGRTMRKYIQINLSPNTLFPRVKGNALWENLRCSGEPGHFSKAVGEPALQGNTGKFSCVKISNFYSSKDTPHRSREDIPIRVTNKGTSPGKQTKNSADQ